MGKRKLKLIIVASLIFLFVFLLHYSLSAQERKLEVEYPEIGGIKPETVATGLPEYVKYVFNFAIGFFGLVVFGALIWGGFLYLTSIGNPAKIKEAKDRIVSAFLGLITLLSSYIILTNINPQLVIFPFPPLIPLAKVEAPKLPPIEAKEINLIATELPLGQSIENGLWQKQRRTEIENLVKEDRNFLSQKIKIDDKEFDRIAGLNKYLKSLTEDCRCENLTKKTKETVEKEEQIDQKTAAEEEKINATAEGDLMVIRNKAEDEREKIKDWANEEKRKIADKNISFDEKVAEQAGIDRIKGQKEIEIAENKIRAEELVEERKEADIKKLGEEATEEREKIEEETETGGALCMKPFNFSQPVSCAGDPCPTRNKINKVLTINREKMTELLAFREVIIDQKKGLENQLSIFQDIEQEMLSCETQQKQLFDLNEHLSRLNYFNELGWKVQTVTVPGAPKPQADPLTFYCSTGGNVFDYPYISAKELPLELTVPELYPAEGIEALQELPKISCPAEIPLGEVIDGLRELAVLLLVKLEKLADLHTKMAAKIEKMEELVSQCNDTRCDISCSCVPNPCYQKCSPKTFWCIPFCLSPCLQTPGGCFGFCPAQLIEEANKRAEDCLKKKCSPEEMEKLVSELQECTDACPRPQIIFMAGEIKIIEEEIFNTVKEINQIFPEVSSLLADETNPKNLKNLRQGFNLCYSPNIEEPTWTLLNCATAINNYGPTGQIIGGCHPRNFFCCSLSEEKIRFPWQAPVSKEPATYLSLQKFAPLPSENGCPQGWLCDPDVKNFNQYRDASQPLKELISCMRTKLDRIQKEKEIKETIGKISSISDRRLYEGICSWEGGSIKPPGCWHDYYVKYKKEIVSAHYGGPFCRLEHKSYAFDLGDEKNFEYFKKAANECRPGVYLKDEGTHTHVSIGQVEGCGTNY